MPKFKVGDILETVELLSNEVGVGVRCKMLGPDDDYPSDMIRVEWLNKSIKLTGKGWWTTRFKLVRHTALPQKKIAMNNKCFDKTIVPHRPRPMP